MNNEELENAINELNKIIANLGDINMNGDSRTKALYQKKLNDSYNRIFTLKKHLEFLRNMEKRKDGKTKRKV